MTNDKGTRAETAAARWLTDRTGEPFTRLPRAGNRDIGDIAAHTLPWLVTEVKNTKVANLGQWQRELAAECANAGASHGVVLWSPPGVGLNDPGRWIALEWPNDRPHIRTHRRAAVPHVGPIARFHRFVAAVDEWGPVITRDNHGATPTPDTCPVVVAQLADRWATALCDHIAAAAHNT